jgi:hypothetical protein
VVAEQMVAVTAAPVLSSFGMRDRGR